jgi:predicted nucleotidyltransferase
MKQIKINLKNLTVAELERTLDKCLVWFFAYPNSKIGLNDLSKSINSSKTSTKQVVESLIRIQFLNREIIGKAWLISAKKDNPYFVTRKIAYNLDLVYRLDIVNAIRRVIPGARAIVLFGSHRWGTDVENSDIDIAVEVIDNEPLRVHNLGLLEHFGYRKNVPVNLHIFSRKKIDSNLFSNIVNGIVLDGFLEVKL